MCRDEIIVEVWRNRDAYVDRLHRSLDEIVEDLRRRQDNPHTTLVDRRNYRSEARATASDSEG